MLLDLIEKNDSITQRDMSSFIGSSVSMINEYLDKYEKFAYVKRIYQSKKKVSYEITKEGIERKKLLNLWFLSDSHNIYIKAKENILSFLHQEIQSPARIFLYGAGAMEVIICDVIENTKDLAINILGIIDDDESKIHKSFKDYQVLTLQSALSNNYDYIFVSSYNYHEAITQKLIQKNIPSKRIIRFFS